MKIKDWRYTVEGMSIHLECECGAITCVLLTQLNQSETILTCHSCSKQVDTIVRAEPILSKVAIAMPPAVERVYAARRLASVA